MASIFLLLTPYCLLPTIIKYETFFKQENCPSHPRIHLLHGPGAVADVRRCSSDGLACLDLGGTKSGSRPFLNREDGRGELAEYLYGSQPAVAVAAGVLYGE